MPLREWLWAGNFTVLHDFEGNDAFPGVLIGDAAGNLVGTTTSTIFSVNAAGEFHEANPFLTPSDGQSPDAVVQAAGNLYGTTSLGGNLKCNSGSYGPGCGNVFMLDKDDNFTVLYNFNGPPDGIAPNSILTDGAGNVYGAANGGHIPGINGHAACGIVFKVDSTGHETILYTFTCGTDGIGPELSVRDAAGNLYGTTVLGGHVNCLLDGCGTVFMLDTTGKKTVLHEFGGPDGEFPQTGMAHDAAGNLYGTTVGGGQFGDGTIFQLNREGLTVLHSFGAFASDGVSPAGGLVRDSAGNLYGMTGGGGAYGFGVIFEFTP